jgi:glycosyltransferase involved in cell wall biosynthesis
MMLISFVIPTFNRCELLRQTIDSVLSMQDEEPMLSYEIIIVDDASTDMTHEMVHKCYLNLIDEGIINFIFLGENIGVTGAKNYGAKHAKGEWIVFLDSDDLIMANFLQLFQIELTKVRRCDAIFFSCVDFSGRRIGLEFSSREISLGEYIVNGFYGEKLPVIRRSVAISCPYIQDLRGFEGLTYFKMLAAGRKFYVSNLVARRYRTDNSDRLSSQKLKLKRAEKMELGYMLLATEFRKLGLQVPVNLLFKILFYSIISRLGRILNSCRYQ